MNKDSKIYVAGHRGMVGSALVRRLVASGYENILVRTRAELDLTEQKAVFDFMQAEKPDYIFLAAAKVGGIRANDTYRADFIYQNLIMECNVIGAAWAAGVKDMLFLGSSCIYPRECPQPISEDYLLTGLLEQTNEPYAIAKIAGVKLCESYNRQFGTRYISAMPTNLYGPNDNYDLENSHVLPALIRKAHEAKINGAKNYTVWGSGKPMREFLYVVFLSHARVHTMESKTLAHCLYNIGTAADVTIRELAETVRSVIGFEGEIIFDSSKPDGTPRKLLNIDRIRETGWSAKVKLKEGISLSYKDFLSRFP